MERLTEEEIKNCFKEKEIDNKLSEMFFKIREEILKLGDVNESFSEGSSGWSINYGTKDIKKNKYFKLNIVAFCLTEKGKIRISLHLRSKEDWDSVKMNLNDWKPSKMGIANRRDVYLNQSIDIDKLIKDIKQSYKQKK